MSDFESRPMDLENTTPTRTRATWKPRVIPDHIPFYRCPECGTIYQGVDSGNPFEITGHGTARMAAMPYEGLTATIPRCCGKDAGLLPLIPVEDVAERIEIDYRIVGGFDNNALLMSWKSVEAGLRPRWVALKTFTGVMTKYVTPDKKPPIIFAFADEDAYAYCDESPCHECTFRCKSGFEMYAYVEGIGLVFMPVGSRILSHERPSSEAVKGEIDRGRLHS